MLLTPRSHLFLHLTHHISLLHYFCDTAWWVKRQRHQYRLKQTGSHHTLTEEREQMLNALDFVWDTRAASWEQRLQELKRFKRIHGHFNVPQEESKLFVWIRSQRRQYKLYCAGTISSLTADRLQKLNSISFDWNLMQNT